MTASILTARQPSCNGSSKGYIKSVTRIHSYEALNNQLQNKINAKAIVNGDPNEYRGTRYLSFSSVQKMLHRLLICDRIILLPTVVPKITELELAKELNITPVQLRLLQALWAFYEKVVKKINRPLINLYCRSALQKPESLHTPCKKHINMEVCYG